MAVLDKRIVLAITIVVVIQVYTYRVLYELGHIYSNIYTLDLHIFTSYLSIIILLPIITLVIMAVSSKSVLAILGYLLLHIITLNRLGVYEGITGIVYMYYMIILLLVSIFLSYRLISIHKLEDPLIKNINSFKRITKESHKILFSMARILVLSGLIVYLQDILGLIELYNIGKTLFLQGILVTVIISLILSFFTIDIIHDYLLGIITCLLYTSPSPRDLSTSRMPSSA
mgnify:CR=1 FL=1